MWGQDIEFNPVMDIDISYNYTVFHKYLNT